jgi:pimeloyl-ACP methyl ester carboxylesterase
MPDIGSITFREHVERGQVTILGQHLNYQLYEIDARPVGPERGTELAEGTPSTPQGLQGNLNVFIPGHWQQARTARSLLRQIAAKSDSRFVWSFDIDPPQGGDPVRAAALIAILRQMIASRIDHDENTRAGDQEPTRVTLYGWSHGGAEALRTVDQAPELFEHLILFCPAGLVERDCWELIGSFTLESLRILPRALGKSIITVRIVLRIVMEILTGLVSDLYHARSIRRVVEDTLWICRKVPSPDYGFKGGVAILFAERDSVIRWRDVFPSAIAQLGGKVTDVSSLAGANFSDFQSDNFPIARKVAVYILPGDHASPETEPELYATTALKLLRG